jgi:hypothetical protein
MDPCLPAGPPPLCGRLPAPCPFNRAGTVPAPLTSACVMLPVRREVGFRTCCLRRACPPGTTRRPLSARGVASWYRPPRPASPRPPRARSWSRMLLTLQARGPSVPRSSPSPFGKTTVGPAAAVAAPREGRRAREPVPARRRGRATWLILPVVICLSQRLSHACASMN